MSDSGGLSERAKARRFPLPLTSMRERERQETRTRKTSDGLCELFCLLESCSPESAGLRSGPVFHSRIEGGCECECDDRRLGDCERDDCDLRRDSQRPVRSCEGGDEIPSGVSYFLSEAKVSHVHTCHRGCSAYVLAQLSRICRDLYTASADNNIFLKQKK